MCTCRGCKRDTIAATTSRNLIASPVNCLLVDLGGGAMRAPLSSDPVPTSKFDTSICACVYGVNRTSKPFTIRQVGDEYGHGSPGSCVYCQHASAFSSGAPVRSSACNDLLQRHYQIIPDCCKAPCPFSMRLLAIDGTPPQSPKFYKCGSTHTGEQLRK